MRTLLLLVLCAAAGASAQTGAFEDISTGSAGQPAARPVEDFVVDGDGRIHALGALPSPTGSSTPPLVMRSGDTWVVTRATGASMLAVSPDGVAYAARGPFDFWGGGRLLRFVDGAWQAFAPGLQGDVTAFVVDTNGHVYVGGFLRLDPLLPEVSVARWDGTSWTALGDLYMEVRALALLPDGGLLAGARATIEDVTYSLMQWDGQTWSPMGGSSEDYVTDLTVSPQGQIAAIGIFSREPPQPPSDVAVWSGEAWHPLGSGADGYAHTVAWLPDGRLALGGTFEAVSGVAARNFAVWDGSTWSPDSGPMGGRIPESVVQRLRVHDEALYVGGRFSVAGSRATSNLARRTADGWAGYGAAADGAVQQWLPDGSGGVYARGRFDTVGDVVTAGIARWTGAAWQGVPDGGPFPVETIALDGTGALLAGGWQPDSLGTRVMRLGSSGWEALGPSFWGIVQALARTTQGDLYVGGGFSDYTTNIHALARWDGAAWVAVPEVPFDRVERLVPLANGGLLVGGAGAPHVALWDGSQWTPMGAGLNDVPSALFERRDGTLLALANSGVWRWTGAAWALLYYHPAATAVTEDADGELIVGAGYGSVYPYQLVRSRGGVWEPIAELDGPVLALHAEGDGRLLVGGGFWHAGGVTSPGVARWVPGGVGTDGAPPAADAVLSIAPNPARTHATVRLGTTHGPVTLALYDLLGRRVATVFNGAPAPLETTVSVAGLPAGVYVVRLASADGVRQTRLVVAR